MIDIRERLVDLYAEGPIEQVHDSAAYRKLCADHVGDRAFDGERYRIEKLRRNIEDYLGKRDSYKAQVEFGLRLLRKSLAEEQEVYQTIPQLEKAIAKIKKEMEKAARDLDFMEAARLRDNMFSMQKQLTEMKK